MYYEYKNRLPAWMQTIEEREQRIEKLNKLPEQDKRLQQTFAYVASLRSAFELGDQLINNNYTPSYVQSCNFELITKNDIAQFGEDLNYVNVSWALQMPKISQINDYFIKW